MAYENLVVTDRGDIRTITINRPKVLNALNRATLQELGDAVEEIHKNPKVKAAILTGAGEKSFVAGADILEMKKLTPLEAEYFSEFGHQVLDRVEALRVPLIAAVNGFALGGGLELALACDFIYASENAVLGLVEVELGLIPGFGGIGRLVRRVGEGMARELIFSAAKVKAQEAKRIGLVNQVTPVGEVCEWALATADSISKKGPYAIQMVKRLINEGRDADLRTANALEQRAFGLVFSSQDHNIGIEAFLEKRKPHFEGR